jgi:hypothetical protein
VPQAAGFGDFYTPLPAVTPERVAEIGAGRPVSDPQVAHQAGNYDQNAHAEYARKGCRVIGYSSFTTGNR